MGSHDHLGGTGMSAERITSRADLDPIEVVMYGIT